LPSPWPITFSPYLANRNQRPTAAIVRNKIARFSDCDSGWHSLQSHGDANLFGYFGMYFVFIKSYVTSYHFWKKPGDLSATTFGTARKRNMK
jgi:hypothetical protein